MQGGLRVTADSDENNQPIKNEGDIYIRDNGIIRMYRREIIRVVPR